jgi:hypothetical protein
MGVTMTDLEQLKASKESFKKVFADKLESIQKKCKHTLVAHFDGYSRDTTLYPTRICMSCGLEEEGGWWCYLNCSHWHLKESFVPAKLGPKENRVFVPRTFDDIMKLRP